ncbi:DUF3488 and transglutaminase-like domain-containing protein [Rubripirellula sp.]|nr:DUF3488 and transglutaminase-like domain-containing protein [Rubripirellula sp.]
MRKNYLTDYRFVRAFPLISALCYQAVALHRWPVTCVLTLLMVVAGERYFFDATRFSKALFCSILSGLALMITAGDSPIVGVLPPLMGEFLLNLLIVCGFIAIGRKKYFRSCLIAWGIIGLSISSDQSLDALFPLLCFASSLLFFSALDSGLFASKKIHFSIYVVFIGLVGLSAAEFGAFTRAAQFLIQDAIASYYDTPYGSGLSGLGQELFVGSRGSIKASQVAVLEVSKPVSRLRSKVFDHFDGSKWFADADQQQKNLHPSAAPFDSADLGQLDFVWLDQPSSSIPTPGGTIKVFGDHVKTVNGWVYHCESSPRFGSLLYDSSERLLQESADLDSLLHVPRELAADLKRFGNRFAGEFPDALSQSCALADHFQQNYTYSLVTNFTGEQHPLIELIQGKSSAYCVYFASAMALTLRTHGIPTRVVSGYVPLERNRFTDSITVRNRDAHAWVEVWIADQERFVAFDPTPMTSRNQVLGIKPTRSFVIEIVYAGWGIIRRLWIQSSDDPFKFLLVVCKSMILDFVIVAGLLICVLAYRIKRQIYRAKDLSGINSDLWIAYRYYRSSLQKKGIKLLPNQPDELAITTLHENGLEQTAYHAERFLDQYRKQRYGQRPDSENLLHLAKQIADN